MPPRLLLELLVERRAGRHVLGVERFHVLDLDEGGDESVAVLRANSEHGLVHEFEMYTGTVARHGAVERRVAVQEVDREPRVSLKNSAGACTLTTKITGTARVSRGVGDMGLAGVGTLVTATFNATQLA